MTRERRLHACVFIDVVVVDVRDCGDEGGFAPVEDRRFAFSF